MTRDVVLLRSQPGVFFLVVPLPSLCTVCGENCEVWDVSVSTDGRRVALTTILDAPPPVTVIKAGPPSKGKQKYGADTEWSFSLFTSDDAGASWKLTNVSFWRYCRGMSSGPLCSLFVEYVGIAPTGTLFATGVLQNRKCGVK